jgi:hypothetical protein
MCKCNTSFLYWINGCTCHIIPKIKIKVEKSTCDVCFLSKTKNKWYSDDFFICTDCAKCIMCNTLDMKIKCELDVNEITNICRKCAVNEFN